MKTLRPIFAIFAISALLASCSTSNDVVGGIFQKRKYNKGFYWNKGSHIPAGKSDDVAKEYKADGQKTNAIRYSEESPSALASRTVTEKNTASPVGYTAVRQASSPERAQAPKQTNSSASNSETKEVSAVHENNPVQQGQAFSGSDSFTEKIGTRSSSGASDVAIVLLVILAIILPWLAVLLFEGASGRFIIVLVLWLLAIFGFFLYPIAGLLMLIAVIYALLIVLGVV